MLNAMEKFLTLIIGAVLSLLVQLAYKNVLVPSYARLVVGVPKIDKTTWTAPGGRMMEIRQTGASIRAKVWRKKAKGAPGRPDKVSVFTYKGRIVGRNLILTWENPESAVHGAMVLRLSATPDKLTGFSTFYSENEAKVVASGREYSKALVT